MLDKLRTYGYVEIVDTKVKDFISELPPLDEWIKNPKFRNAALERHLFLSYLSQLITTHNNSQL